jgi:hydroxymethylbilane synthase
MAERNNVLIATRGSALALTQSNMMLAECRAAFPGQSFDLNIIKTTGDKLQTASMASSALPKGLFTKELEVALLANEADFAVHSLKDLPTELPAGLKLGAVSKRADVRDVLIYRGPSCAAAGSKFSAGLMVKDLPEGAHIATSSTRRRAQLLDRRPDLKISEIRGNVGTRLRKLAENPDLDGTILAAAGLNRLGFFSTEATPLAGPDFPGGLLAMPISLDEMLPCVGQAAIGIESRENDARIDRICAALNDATTIACVTAERSFLRAMGGGCQLAVAAHAEIVGNELRMRGVSFLGAKPIRGDVRGRIQDADRLGQELASKLK